MRELGLKVEYQDFGQQSFRENQFAGSVGKSHGLCGFQLQIDLPVENLSVKYNGHFQDIADVPFVKEGELLGNVGRPRRLEGFAIELTGSASEKYDVLYMAHVQHVGFIQLYRKGEFCGTKGQALQVEAILVRIIPHLNQSDFDTLAEVYAQLGNRTPSEIRVIRELIRKDGMTEQRITAYCQAEGLAPPNMSVPYQATDWLTHDFEGQWRVKPSYANALRQAVEAFIL